MGPLKPLGTIFFLSALTFTLSGCDKARWKRAVKHMADQYQEGQLRQSRQQKNQGQNNSELQRIKHEACLICNEAHDAYNNCLATNSNRMNCRAPTCRNTICF